MNEQTFQVCDDVWLLKGGKIRKFEDQYSGPYQIVETLPDGNVRIQLDAKRSKVVHTNRLRHSFIESNKNAGKKGDK